MTYISHHLDITTYITTSSWPTEWVEKGNLQQLLLILQQCAQMSAWNVTQLLNNKICTFVPHSVKWQNQHQQTDAFGWNSVLLNKFILHCQNKTGNRRHFDPREPYRPTRWIESVHICTEGQQATNQDEGSYQLSHTYDRFLDTTAGHCVDPEELSTSFRRRPVKEVETSKVSSCIFWLCNMNLFSNKISCFNQDNPPFLSMPSIVFTGKTGLLVIRWGCRPAGGGGVMLHICTHDLDLWPLTFKTFSAMPTRMNICACQVPMKSFH